MKSVADLRNGLLRELGLLCLFTEHIVHQVWRLLVLVLLALVFVLFFTRPRRLANRRARRALMAVIPVEIQFEDADPANFSRLDKDHLETLTAEMQKLGFACLRDYTTVIPGKPVQRGFARLLVHRSERCFAEIMATSQAMIGGLPLRVAINSYLEDEWELGTSNVAPKRGHYFQQLPKVLRMRYSDAEPAELFQRHLARRAEILEALHIKIHEDLSIDSYFARIRKRMVERREAMQSHRPLDELSAATTIAAQRSYEWLGDFPKERERQLVRKN